MIVGRLTRSLCKAEARGATKAAGLWSCKSLWRGFAAGGGQSNKDYYSRINKTASKPEIKKAFAKLAQQYHPDKNPAPEAKEKFKDITEAYQTLNDENKRQMYDNYGMNADQQTNFNQQGGGMGGQNFNQADFNDFFKGGDFNNMFRDFEDFFGMGGMGQQQGRAMRGQDIMLNLEITFMESVMGVTKEISFMKNSTCSTCQGSRCKPGTSPTKCTTCGGSGSVNMRQGPMSIHMVCNRCKGSGESIKSPCGTCAGTGTAKSTTKESISIPKGINNGQNLRINGKGAVSNPEGPPGDLIVKITVKPDPYFKRDGFDIITSAFISIPQAVLGTSLNVRTLYGNMQVDVPAGTVDGQIMRLKSQGVTKLAPNHHQKGDHLITFKIAVPNKLSAEQREIYEKLRQLEETKQN